MQQTKILQATRSFFYFFFKESPSCALASKFNFIWFHLLGNITMAICSLRLKGSQKTAGLGMALRRPSLLRAKFLKQRPMNLLTVFTKHGEHIFLRRSIASSDSQKGLKPKKENQKLSSTNCGFCVISSPTYFFVVVK